MLRCCGPSELQYEEIAEFGCRFSKIDWRGDKRNKFRCLANPRTIAPSTTTLVIITSRKIPPQPAQPGWRPRCRPRSTSQMASYVPSSSCAGSTSNNRSRPVEESRLLIRDMRRRWERRSSAEGTAHPVRYPGRDTHS